MEAISTKTFSPKELAQVVGVSESSIKRWVDDELIAVTRTAGGHRRIGLREALRFIRSQGMRVQRPDLIGLPDVAGLPAEMRQGALTADLLFTLLERGAAASVRGVLVQQYLDGTPLAELFDGPVTQALTRVGGLWEQRPDGIYVEHMATALCIEALSQIRLLLPAPGPEAPTAVGGGPSGDPYLLPNLMAAAVLAASGYHEINLGPNTPPVAFMHAVEAQRPALTWISFTAPLDERAVAFQTEHLLDPLAEAGIEVVIGGQQVAHWREKWPGTARQMSSMKDLADHANRLRHAA